MFADIADYNARVENNVSGIRVVQAFANEKHEMERFADNNNRFRLAKLVAYRIMAWNSSISFILMKSISLFVLVCGTWFVIQDRMTYGEFIAFIMLSNVFLGPIKQINSVIETYPKGIAGFKKISGTAGDGTGRSGRQGRRRGRPLERGHRAGRRHVRLRKQG